MWPPGALKLTSRTAWTTARRRACAESEQSAQPAPLAGRRGDERSGDAADLDHRPGSEAFAWAARKDTNAGGRGTLAAQPASTARASASADGIDEAEDHVAHAADRHHAMAGVGDDDMPGQRPSALATRSPWRGGVAGSMPPLRTQRRRRTRAAASRTPPAPRRAARSRRASRTSAANVLPNSLPGLSAADARRGRSSAQTTERCMPVARRIALRRPLGRAQADQRRHSRRAPPPRSPRAGRRPSAGDIERTAHRAEHELARQRELLFGAGQRMLRLDLARQALPAARRSGRAESGCASAQPARQRRLGESDRTPPGCRCEKLAGKRHVGRRRPPSITVRRTVCGNWRSISSATRVP